MSFRKPRIAILLAAASATLLLQAPAALAINFGDMMSPGRWMGGNNDDDDDYDIPWLRSLWPAAGSLWRPALRCALWRLWPHPLWRCLWGPLRRTSRLGATGQSGSRPLAR